MSDFLLDFRPVGQRSVKPLAERMRFVPEVQVRLWHTPAFDLAVTYPVNEGLWGAFTNGTAERFTAVAGRIALPESSWQQAEHIPGDGGLACKALDTAFAVHGVAALENLSGNFALLLWDGRLSTFHIVTDCTGVFPVYEFKESNALLIGSHPDILASAAGQQENLDEVSLAEFAVTSSVSPPFTYYRNIRAVGRAMTLSVTIARNETPTVTRRCYFPFRYQGCSTDREEDLAEQLAAAFRNAVALRSSPRLGRCAVALSGGLDSRAVLASLAPGTKAFAFTLYDAENAELRSASALARAAGVEFYARQRPFEYYADNAELGMRVAGGMGTIANNHFLGTLSWLREQGAETFLTGCYCDYLFKALPVNRETNPLSGRETLAPYRREFYFTQFWPKSTLAEQVRERIDSRFPEAVTRDQSDSGVFELEHRRTFPLCYEADNAQRLVPQRLSGWFLPISDPELLRLYCRMPYRWKLNRSIFSKAVTRICPKGLNAVADANTSVPPGASFLREAVSWNLLRARTRLKKLKPGLATNGSWPDWYYYAAHSERLASLWAKPNPVANELFARVLGHNHFSRDIRTCSGEEIWQLMPLLSLKLWMEQRAA